MAFANFLIRTNCAILSWKCLSANLLSFHIIRTFRFRTSDWRLTPAKSPANGFPPISLPSDHMFPRRPTSASLLSVPGSEVSCVEGARVLSGCSRRRSSARRRHTRTCCCLCYQPRDSGSRGLWDIRDNKYKADFRVTLGFSPKVSFIYVCALLKKRLICLFLYERRVIFFVGYSLWTSKSEFFILNEGFIFMCLLPATRLWSRDIWDIRDDIWKCDFVEEALICCFRFSLCRTRWEIKENSSLQKG